MTIHILAAVAEHESEATSQRTKAALAAAKARGVKLGGRPENLKHGDVGTVRSAEVRSAKAVARARDLEPTIQKLRETGVTSLRGLAQAFNERGIPAPRGGTWHASQVRALLRRLED